MRKGPPLRTQSILCFWVIVVQLTFHLRITYWDDSKTIDYKMIIYIAIFLLVQHWGIFLALRKWLVSETKKKQSTMPPCSLICPSIHPSVHSYNHLSIHTSISPFIHPSVHSYIHLSIHTSISPFILVPVIDCASPTSDLKMTLDLSRQKSHHQLVLSYQGNNIKPVWPNTSNLFFENIFHKFYRWMPLVKCSNILIIKSWHLNIFLTTKKYSCIFFQSLSLTSWSTLCPSHLCTWRLKVSTSSRRPWLNVWNFPP